MKITLIRPNMFKTKSSDAMQPLAIAALMSQIPEDVQVEFFDERIEVLPEEFQTDLVAISVETFTAKRAYEIAEKIRAKGIPVVLGGIHATALPDEALEYSDSVVIGESEGIWDQVIRDAKNGNLKKIYSQDEKPCLKGITFNRSLFKGKKYTPIIPVQFGRGCKNSCEFCSVHAFFGKGIRYRPVEEVVSEIKDLEAKNIFFVDDNIFINEAITNSLLKALIPLKIKWTSQASIDIVNKPELLKLMKQSGCISLIIGFETMDDRNLKLMKKGINMKNDYASAIKTLNQYGIMIYGTFIIGYDFDHKNSFSPIYEFAMENNLMLANFNPLIPMPGTDLYKRFEEEGRLIYKKWWLDPNYRYGDTVFTPRGMCPEELANGCLKTRMEFNKISSIMKRLIRGKSNHKSILNAGIFLGSNLISKIEIKKKQGAILGDNSLLGQVGEEH